MKIDHVALYVENLEGMRGFYIEYFAATSNEMYHNEKTGLRTYFLRFPDGGGLEIMARPDVLRRRKGAFDAGYIHLAVSVGGEEAVDRLTARLEKDGVSVTNPPRRTGDGYYESCVLDPEGNLIEIVA